MARAWLCGWFASMLATMPTLAAGPAVVADGDKVRIQAYPASITEITVWVAVEGGHCRNHGLACEIVEIPSGPLGLQALAAGSLEVSAASNEVTMAAASRGNDVQLIAGKQPNNVYELDVRSDVPLPHLAQGYPAVMQDLKGLKVGVTARGAGTEIQMRALLQGAGMKPEDVTFVAVGAPGTSYPALTNKQIDMALSFPPFATLCAVRKTCVSAVNLRAGEGPKELKAINGGFESFAARRDYIAAHPKVIKAFIQAIDDATRWAQDPANYPAVLAIVRKHFSLGDMPDADAILDRLVRTELPTFGTAMDRKAVQAVSDFLLAFKIIETPVDAGKFVYAEAP